MTAKPNQTDTASKPIVCGTDFSSFSKTAADAAVALGRKFKQPLCLLHATDVPASTIVKSGIKEEAGRLRQAGVEVRESLLIGNADEQLAVHAEKNNALMVVVGSLGKRAPERWLLGSVSERAAMHSKVPALVVRDAAPFVAWAAGKQPLRVVVATDFSSTSAGELRWVRDHLLAAGKCEVTVTYIGWTPEERERFGREVPLSRIGSLLRREIKEWSTALLGREPDDVAVELNWGRADYRIGKLAQEIKPDLIVVGTHQHHGLERLDHTSVSRGILHHVPVNTLCIPAGTEPAKPLPAKVIHRVLAATDFSAAGAAAVEAAVAQLALGGELRLLHVTHSQLSRFTARPVIWEKDSPFGPPESVIDKSALETRLQALVPAPVEGTKLSITVDITEDEDTSTAICQAAERMNADVICIGAHGQSRLSAFVLGSVAQKVITTTRRYVLLAHARPD